MKYRVKVFDHNKVYSILLPTIIIGSFLAPLLIGYFRQNDPIVVLSIFFVPIASMIGIIIYTTKKYVYKTNLNIRENELQFENFKIPYSKIKKMKLRTYQITRIHLHLKTNKILVINPLNHWNSKSNEEIYELEKLISEKLNAINQ